MKITRAGVDIAKSVFHVHAVDRHDRPQWQAVLRRGKWLDALCFSAYQNGPTPAREHGPSHILLQCVVAAWRWRAPTTFWFSQFS